MRTPNVDFCAKPILITGAAGFIGSFLAMELLRSVDNVRIVGVDSMNDYYDVALKEHRLWQIEALAAQKPGSRWEFVRGNIADAALLEALFARHGFGIVVNLAAQAGVRYSITNPDAYVESNLVGFYRILEACRQHPVEHLVYASSFGVWRQRQGALQHGRQGGSAREPVRGYQEEQRIDGACLCQAV